MLGPGVMAVTNPKIDTATNSSKGIAHILGDETPAEVGEARGFLLATAQLQSVALREAGAGLHGAGVEAGLDSGDLPAQ